jgi:hypothetical protein
VKLEAEGWVVGMITVDEDVEVTGESHIGGSKLCFKPRVYDESKNVLPQFAGLPCELTKIQRQRVSTGVTKIRTPVTF